MSKAEQLIACLEGEIAKRDEELAACRVSVENCDLFRARIVELERNRDKILEERDAIAGGAEFWNDGKPPHPYGSEWFIARLKDGSKAVLRELPEEFSHDYKTADNTYYTADWIIRWAQFPDSAYLLYAAPVSSIKAQGVVMPDTEDFCFCGKHVSLQMISGGASNHGYLGSVTLLIDGEYVEYTRLKAAPAHQVNVPDGWNDGYRSAMNSAATGARQLYVQHCHHHGVNGLLDRCKELEQSFIRDADASTSAAQAAPAADAGVNDHD